MSRDEPPDYARPFTWWGVGWNTPDPHSLLWLISHGVLDHEAAAFLTLAVERRSTIIVCAEGSGVGKTTLLTALSDFLPQGSSPIFLRGMYERFAFSDTIAAADGYLLCNEISAHLPAYLWGRGVRQVFDAVAEGYPLLTSMHASDGRDVLRQLRDYPLDVSADRLQRIDLVVTLSMGLVSNRRVRRLTRIERVLPPLDGERGDDVPRVMSLAERDPLRADLVVHTGRLVGTLAAWYLCSDVAAAALLARRAHLLRTWAEREAGATSESSLRPQIEAYRAASEQSSR